MSDWVIYLFIVVLLVSYGFLARNCFRRGSNARWWGEKLPGIIGFTLLVTIASLAVDLGRHGIDYLIENPSVIAARFVVVLALQLIPYAAGVVAGRKHRTSDIIGMD